MWTSVEPGCNHYIWCLLQKQQQKVQIGRLCVHLRAAEGNPPTYRYLMSLARVQWEIHQFCAKIGIFG